jgi:hypothetical protein
MPARGLRGNSVSVRRWGSLCARRMGAGRAPASAGMLASSLGLLYAVSPETPALLGRPAVNAWTGVRPRKLAGEHDPWRRAECSGRLALAPGAPGRGDTRVAPFGHEPIPNERAVTMTAGCA